jgi:hypothetical protein
MGELMSLYIWLNDGSQEMVLNIVLGEWASLGDALLYES